MLAARYGPTAMISPRGVLRKNTHIFVYLPGTHTPATLYTSKSKTATVSNPILTDSAGNLTFFADPGDYDLAVNSSDAPLSITVGGDGSGSSAVGVVNPMDYGLIADGDPHPLSERYSTLSAAQADYPFLSAMGAGLSDQIDWAAWQAALADITVYYAGYTDFGLAAVQGGTVECPFGRHVFSRPVLYGNNTHFTGPGASYDEDTFLGCVLMPSADFVPGGQVAGGRDGLLKFQSDWMLGIHITGIMGSGLSPAGTQVVACGGLIRGGSQGMGENSLIDDISGSHFASHLVYIYGSNAPGCIGSINGRENLSVLCFEESNGPIIIRKLSGDNNVESVLKLFGSSNHCCVSVEQIKSEANAPWGSNPSVKNQDPIVKLDSFQGSLRIENLEGAAWEYPANNLLPPGPNDSMVKILAPSKSGYGGAPSVVIENISQAIAGGPTYSYDYVLDATAAGGSKHRLIVDGLLSPGIVFAGGTHHDGPFDGSGWTKGGPRLTNFTMLEVGAGDVDLPDILFGQYGYFPGTMSLTPGDPTDGVSFGMAGSVGQGNQINTFYGYLAILPNASQDLILGAWADTGILDVRRHVSFTRNADYFTTATAGPQAALPATCSGYLAVTVQGYDLRIPLFNA